MSLGSMLGIGAWKQRLPREADLLPGRAQPLPLRNVHHVTGRPLRGDAVDGSVAGMEMVDVGMGCFWGAERKFWNLPGVYTTAVGYAGGGTPNPTYEEVCSGQTGHTEAVRVIYDPAQVDLATVLKTFWESHDPTQGMRQGNDVGTQYRSAVFFSDELQREVAARYIARLDAACVFPAPIVTTLEPLEAFHLAEDYHQDYYKKNPIRYKYYRLNCGRDAQIKRVWKTEAK